MPIYSYKCNICGEKKEEWFPVHEDAVKSSPCNNCEGNLEMFIEFSQVLLGHAKKFTGALRPKKALVDGKVVDLTK